MMFRYRRILSLVLTFALLLGIAVPAAAAEEEEYLYDIRIVYGENLQDAQNRLAKSEFSDYKLFEYNLNEGTEAHMAFIGLGEEPHVYIAYQTTTDVDLAITDIAVMDMYGGFSEGNLPAMLEESMAEYETFAAYYMQAIDYFKTAYDSGSRLADAALRQLNLYLDPDSGMRLGDLLFDDISSEALATILLQGNTNVLDNMRSLLAMGTSYNESGLSYLETVAQTAAQMDADSAVFENENWYELSQLIIPTFSVFREMIHEYESIEDTLDYTDDTTTEDEILYMEYATITKMLQETPYLNGQNLADFICNYQEADDGYLTVYPLIAAMNKGQIAMTELCQFYNVIRYSSTDLAADIMEEEITELEASFADGLDIYVGVDRDLYNGTIAVTSAADRAAATAGRDVASDIFLRGNAIASYVVTGLATIGNICLLVHNLKIAAETAEAISTVNQIVSDTQALVGSAAFSHGGLSYTVPQAVNALATKYHIAINPSSSILDQANTLLNHFATNPPLADDAGMLEGLSNAVQQNSFPMRTEAYTANEAASHGLSYTGTWCIFGGIMLAITAVNIGIWIYNYYNPELTDIPLAMVDALSTDEGDRYICYDVVKSIDNEAADVNAFEGVEWNALYFTRNYEAGNPLLADFDINYDSNQAEDGYVSIHKFGDTVGFNMNENAFGDELQIYLSAAQSENQKSFVTDVPDVIGSILSIGSYFLVAGLGVGVGIGIMAMVQRSKNAKKKAV